MVYDPIDFHLNRNKSEQIKDKWINQCLRHCAPCQILICTQPGYKSNGFAIIRAVISDVTMVNEERTTIFRPWRKKKLEQH